jgi:ubiquinone/menaquinone biosynthesis C-methylase UbiE
MRVLDVGCGTGAQLEQYVAAHYDVAGIDASPAMLGRARKRLGEAVDLRFGDAQQLPFDDGIIDLVTATLVLHELAPGARDVVAKEMLRVLMDDGPRRPVSVRLVWRPARSPTRLAPALSMQRED